MYERIASSLQRHCEGEDGSTLLSVLVFSGCIAILSFTFASSLISNTKTAAKIAGNSDFTDFVYEMKAILRNSESCLRALSPGYTASSVPYALSQLGYANTLGGVGEATWIGWRLARVFPTLAIGAGDVMFNIGGEVKPGSRSFRSTVTIRAKLKNPVNGLSEISDKIELYVTRNDSDDGLRGCELQRTGADGTTLEDRTCRSLFGGNFMYDPKTTTCIAR